MSGTAQRDSTASSLLRGLRSHDPQAWQRMARMYTPMVYRWCRACGLQASDAADIGQEVFRAVYRGIDDFRRDKPGDSFRAWLRTITANKINDWARARKKQPPGKGGSDQGLLNQVAFPAVLSDSDAPAAGSERAALARRLMAMVQSEFEPRTWQAFWRVVIDGQPAAEVASDLNMGVASVYKAKQRVLRRLRDHFEQES
jgi:RNA polymerase sigma-70 factor, ECF subfamily